MCRERRRGWAAPQWSCSSSCKFTAQSCLHDPLPRPSAGLSAYEQERQDRIARNEAFLKSLGIDGDKKELVKPKTHPAKKRKEKEASIKKTKNDNLPTKTYNLRERKPEDDIVASFFVSDDEGSELSGDEDSIFSDDELIDPLDVAASFANELKVKKVSRKVKKPASGKSRKKHRIDEAEALLMAPISTFEEMADRYRRFRALCPNENPKQDSILGGWAYRMRNKKPDKGTRKSTKQPLSMEQVATLDGIGFLWDGRAVWAKNAEERSQEAFEKNFQEYVKFRKDNGRDPRCCENTKLYNWLAQMRRANQGIGANVLRAADAERLTRAGMNWVKITERVPSAVA